MSKFCTTQELEEKVHGLDKDIAVLKHIQEKDVEAMDSARKIQAIEYERRLENLNGEATRIKEIQATYLPRETWDNTLAEIRKELADLSAHKDNAVGRQSVVAVVVSTLIGLAFVLLNYVLK